MIVFRQAETEKDKSAAYTLIQEVYTAIGYASGKPEVPSPFAVYQALDTTVTFVAEEDANVQGAISLVLQSEQGLPMECIFKEELATLHEKGLCIGEVCQFAIKPVAESDQRGRVHELEVSTGLLGQVLRAARKANLDTLVFVVNPKHASFYESLGCTQLGMVKPDPMVNDAPACAYVLDIQKTLTEGSGKQHFLARKLYSFLHDPVQI